MKRTGFINIEVVERHPFGLAHAEDYPLFTDEVVELMRRLIPRQRHDQIAVSVTVTADNPR